MSLGWHTTKTTTVEALIRSIFKQPKIYIEISKWGLMISPTNTPPRPPPPQNHGTNKSTSQSPLTKVQPSYWYSCREAFVRSKGWLGFSTKTPDLFFLVWISGFWFFPWEFFRYFWGVVIIITNHPLCTRLLFLEASKYSSKLSMCFFGGGWVS